jgi:Myb-like DNA-binding protein FlbD
MNSHRTFFTAAEDAMIIKLRKKNPLAKWSSIAKRIKGKTAKQCNDRYNKHLKQEKNNSPWTAEEDARLLDLVSQHGHNWVVVSKLIGTRSNIESKNRWTVLDRLRKNRKKTSEQIKFEVKNNFQAETPQPTIPENNIPDIFTKKSDAVISNQATETPFSDLFEIEPISVDLFFSITDDILHQDAEWDNIFML